MANDPIQTGILGDISPKPGTEDHVRSNKDSGGEHEDTQSMDGGSQHGRSGHSGSRDITEGVTGGLGTEVGEHAQSPTGHRAHRRRHRQQA